MEAGLLDVEIVTHVTGSMDHCDHCQVFIDGVGIGEQIHQQDIQSYPQDLIRDWQRVSDWVIELAATFPGQLRIRITDAQSPQGLWKNLTKGIRRYPTFIVGGKEKYHGWNHEDLNEIVRRHLTKQRS